MKRTPVLFALLTLVLALTAGCSSGELKRHPAYVKAERARASGDYRTAAEELERLLRLRPEAAALHLELANLYDENLGDKLRACWHYEEFLTQVPDYPEAPVIRALARHARRQALDAWLLAGDTPGPEPELSGNPEKLSREVVLLRRENARLRAELMLTRAGEDLAAMTTAAVPLPTPVPSAPSVPAVPPNPAPAAAPVPVPVPTPAEQRVYTIAGGDTLEKISRKMYGSGRYANLILQANRDTVKSERGLQIGQRLVIPPLPAEE